MERLELTILPEWEGRTVKSILRRELALPESRISRIKFRERGILLNGDRTPVNARVHPGDRLSADWGDRLGGNGARPMEGPLEILYEDEYLAVLNKPAHMAVHGPESGQGCTVQNVLAARWGPDRAFHPVNRLDRDTTGLMVAAKSGYIHDRLRRMLHTDGFRREYLALAAGTLPAEEGSILLPMGRQEGEPRRRAVREDGRPARTDYRVLGRKGEMLALWARPVTGRTHQLRVHFASVGAPLWGDALYGGRADPGEGAALHSYRLTLRHPVSGQRLCLEAPPPERLERLWGGPLPAAPAPAPPEGE